MTYRLVGSLRNGLLLGGPIAPRESADRLLPADGGLKLVGPIDKLQEYDSGVMTPDEAQTLIGDTIVVTRADIVAAKAYFLSLGNGLISLRVQLNEWVKAAVPGAPRVLTLYGEDSGAQVTTFARAISARLAGGAAAWELVRSGLAFQVGAAVTEEPEVAWTTVGPGRGGSSSSFGWSGRFTLFYPEHIRRPVWLTFDGDLLDADLFLQRFDGFGLNPHVRDALEQSLACFRAALFVPSAAMLGAASEAAWIELGQSLARANRGNPAADKLASLLDDAQTSTKMKINRTCHFYESQTCERTRATSEVRAERLRAVQAWSDLVREARNVLHWGAQAAFPNTYEKAAIMLMDAVDELLTLQRVQKAVRDVK